MADKEIVIDVETLDTIGDLFSAWILSEKGSSKSPNDFIKEKKLSALLSSEEMRKLLEGDAAIPRDFVPALKDALPFEISVEEIRELNRTTIRKSDAYVIDMNDADIREFHYNHISDEERKKLNEDKAAILKGRAREYFENSLFAPEEVLDTENYLIDARGVVRKKKREDFITRVKKAKEENAGKLDINRTKRKKKEKEAQQQINFEVEKKTKDDKEELFTYQPRQKHMTLDEKRERARELALRNNVPEDAMTEEELKEYKKIKKRKADAQRRGAIVTKVIKEYREKVVEKENARLDAFVNRIVNKGGRKD